MSYMYTMEKLFSDEHKTVIKGENDLNSNHIMSVVQYPVCGIHKALRYPVITRIKRNDYVCKLF